MKNAFCSIFLLVALHAGMHGDDFFPARKLFVAVNAGIGFPYSRGFIGNCYPAAGYGFSAGYAFSGRFSLQLAYERYTYKLKHPDMEFGDESSPHEVYLVDSKFNLRASRLSSYLALGVGISGMTSYSVVVIVGQEPIITKHIQGYLVFSPGFGFQYRIKPALFAFLEFRYGMQFSHHSGMDVFAYDFGEIPVKLGFVYYF